MEHEVNLLVKWVDAAYLKGDGRQVSLFYDNWTSLGPLTHQMNAEEIRWGAQPMPCDWWNPEVVWLIPASFSKRYPRFCEVIMHSGLEGQAHLESFLISGLMSACNKCRSSWTKAWM